MVSSEIRDTIMIAVSAILLAALLGFITFLVGVRGDLAEIRNSEIYATESIAYFKKYNNYNNTTLYGEDVIAAIRDLYDTNLVIRVNKDGSNYYEITKEDAKLNPSLVEIEYLKTLFSTESEYKSILVYDQVNLTTVTESYARETTSDEVVAIVFIYQGERS